MSRSTQINGVSFPGEVKTPKEGDIVITWKSKKHVEVYATVRTYECPLNITVGILLDMSLENE